MQIAKYPAKLITGKSKLRKQGNKAIENALDNVKLNTETADELQ